MARKALTVSSIIEGALRPSVLLEHLLTSLQNVTHLEFSLVEAFNYAKEELLKIRLLANVHKGRETKVRKVYVEVADEKNADLLQTFLRYCPYLRDLHVHFVRYVRFDLGLVNRLSTFTFTCEASSTAQSDPRQPVDLSYCIDLHGNVVFRKRPQAYNCAQLRNLALSPNTAFPLEPVVLVAVETKDLGRQFLIAGSRHNWSKLRSLCVLLYAGNLDQTVCPTISANYETALRDFFAKLLNLVELNVSSFHFSDGVDFTELLAAPALRRLRALSLPPCGLRQNGAVRRLALGLSDIEDLDIRLNLDGRHESCSSCSRELVIAPADASAFRLGSGRLTLSNVPNLASLNFLECLQVSCLRFIDVSAGPRFDFHALAKVVRYGNILHSLVVKLQSIGFGESQQCRT
ncbi:hypothetical protein HPB52_014439 [Rhipicephalus sanguineus]|uniref:Uncharacterized protein n=1 Tax=Rhipicephalus sanguineus TaxID=34632 RepID=A0A9D4PBL2_RHISA|nr:hypothetical protein HPB52_014439 [Rhipicephalus sanguineus]